MVKKTFNGKKIFTKTQAERLTKKGMRFRLVFVDGVGYRFVKI